MAEDTQRFSDGTAYEQFMGPLDPCHRYDLSRLAHTAG